MKHHCLLPAIAIIATIAASSSVQAQTPALIPYQGRVQIGTPPADFNGTGQFRFALMQGTTATRLWVNNGPTTADPANPVSLTVSNGLYSVMLGDNSDPLNLPNMAAIPPSVFANPDVRLRVWFNDGENGFKLLTPDQRLAPTGYVSQLPSLSFGNSIANTKIALWEGGGFSYGMGIQASQFRLHTSNSSDRFSFLNAPNGTENLTILGDGNVGIGTTSPKQRLHVNGDYYGRGHVWLHANEGDGASGTAYIQARDTSGESSICLTLRSQFNGAPMDGLKITTSGNPYLPNGTLLMGPVPWATTPLSVIAAPSGGSLYFMAGGLFPTQMAILANGNVGIGTSTPTQKLTVGGAVQCENLLIVNGGNLIRGNRYLSEGAGQNWDYAYWSDVSDARLKKEVTPLTGALDSLALLRAVTFRWNDQGLKRTLPDMDKRWIVPGDEAATEKLRAEKRAEAAHYLDRKQWGFIAQEVEKVFPEWVLTDPQGYKTINAKQTSALLVQGIHELHAAVKTQTANLAVLEDKNTALQKENAALKAALAVNAARDEAQDVKLATLTALLEKQSAATAGASTVSAQR